MSTATITLGHNGLTRPVGTARNAVQTAVRNSDGTILASFRDGLGTWTDSAGHLLSESCDAWVVAVPESTEPRLRSVLQRLAHLLGQDAIGFLIHDTATYGPSYVEAKA